MTTFYAVSLIIFALFIWLTRITKRVLIRVVKSGGNITDEFFSEKMRYQVLWDDLKFYIGVLIGGAMVAALWW